MPKSLLAKGLSVTPGFIRGKARIVKNPDDVDNIEIGDIVILPKSHPMYSLAMMNASGVICEVGGKLSHICLVSMEMGIPCITQVQGFSKKIKNGQLIAMDANKGDIYSES